MKHTVASTGRLLRVACLLCGLTTSLYAQFDDVNLWMNLSVEHKFTQRISASIAEELRMNYDVSQVDVLFTDVGLEYIFTKSIRAAVNYRFISKNQPTFYSKRHRLYADVSWRHKFKPFTITVRERIQKQVQDIFSSESGYVPEWYSRTKLTAKLDLEKKYFPYVAFEVHYLIDNAKEEDEVINKMRYEVGFDYEFNRKNKLNLFGMYQRNRVEDFNDLIFGVGYSYTL